jgi:mannose-6-phosphate isomerase-like protein (cupin superfamily)
MSTFAIDRVASALEAGGRRYHEFLRVSALSVGLYRLRAGSRDEQQPHAEDEVYYALSGRARLRVGGDDHEVAPGTVAFVGARVDHRFHDITEDLTLLVFFAPAEGSADDGKRAAGR